MTTGILRSLIATCCFAATVAAAPEAQSCEFLNRLFGCGSQSTYSAGYASYYAPAAPACSSCSYAPVTSCSSCSTCPTTSSCTPCSSGCAPTTTYMPAVPSSCSTCTTYYTPQTYYRPVVQPVAVTTYQPVTSFTLLGGFRTVGYQPVTTVRPAVAYAPYSTYAVTSAPAVSCAAPAVSYSAPASSCPTCPNGATVTAPAATQPTSAPATTSDPAAATPTLKPIIPETNQTGPALSAPGRGTSGSATPSIFNGPSERTTQRTIETAARVNWASLPTQRPADDFGGWQAAD